MGKGEKGENGERSRKGEKGDKDRGYEKGGSRGYDRDDRGKGGYDRDDRGKGGYDRDDRGKGGYDRDDRGKGGYDRDDRGKGGGYDKGKGGKAGDWTCPGCGVNVFASKDACFKCGEPRPSGGGGGGGGGYEKGDGKGKADGKGKKGREEKLVASGLKGKIIKLIGESTGKKPSGFIKRYDGEGRADVYFDLVDVLGENAEVNDIVEFDVVEGSGQRLYAARVKRLPKDTPLVQEKNAGQLSAPMAASTAGSLTGSLTGGLRLGGPSKLGSKPGSLTGGLSLRPGGLSGGALTLGPGGTLSASMTKKKEEKPQADDSNDGEGGDGEDGLEWGRVVSVRNAFGFLKPLGNSEKKMADVFFRAVDVVGMNCTDPGHDGIEIVLPNGRSSNGFRSFWLNEDDEVSFTMSKDSAGKPCAIYICKEKKGAWRLGAPRRPKWNAEPEVSLKDQVNRLVSMDADQVLQNASLFKDVLDSPDFNPSHLYKIIALLASKELADDDRSDTLYRLFLHSNAIQTSLRTAIIKQSCHGSHNGTFLEDCLRLLTELTVRSNSPADLRGQLPLTELVEAVESSIRDGSTMTKKGLPEEMVQMLMCLQKHFPVEVNLNRILGTRAPKTVRTVAESATELMEADYYQDMPILPTSYEMNDQAAFEIEENCRTYEKCEDYIQTHFMLLREDYIEPLRLGISQFMQSKHSPKDIHVYTKVKVVGLLSTNEGLVYRVEFPKAQVRGINWEKSKKLMYGSLLCFSDDEFETLIWATVWRRDADLMSQSAQLDIKLPFEPVDERLVPGRNFCCIENTTIYFEAYRHVLIALQAMRPSDVPFQNTLLTAEPEAVPPTFLTPGNDMFHFHNVFHSCVKEDAPVSLPKCFNILQDWPDTLQQSLDIDPSQLEAIQHALTHQVALIQGPPGTGKTWVGLKIVQAILDNTKSTRRSPIMVVCYTNHALDQFLEGIFKFCERIARIGSRSKSECMQGRNLKELVFQMEPSKEYFQARRGLNDRRDTLRENFLNTLQKVNKHVVELDEAQSLFSDRKYIEFFEGYRDFMGNNKSYMGVSGIPKEIPEDADDIDDDLWTVIMKAWLDISDLAKIAKPMIESSEGKSKTAEQDFGGWEELLNDDQGEEEAEQEQNDRALDVEQNQDQGEKKKGPAEFCMELKNAWLPTLEAHLAKLSPEMLTLSASWQDQDLWSLPISCRREIYRRWLLEAHHEAREEIPELARMLERNADHRQALERDRKLALLQEMEVVGMTTTAVSKYSQLLKELRPEIVIVEEAAEVLEAHILTALHPRTQHVVLIGDHQQLRPSTAVYRLSKNFHLDVSLFERLIKNNCDHVTLEQQRRMHPKVSRLMKPLYPQLRDHSSVSEYPEVLGIDARVFFMTHNHMEDAEGTEGHSKENSFEANFIGSLCSHLVRSGYEESQITVLSPYLGQVRVIKNRLRRDVNTTNVQITAVDNFQGEENDIIVISLVRSNRNKSMGFLAVENRINVALTRAKHGMFIVGNSDMLKGHKLWTSIMNNLGSDGCFSDRMPLVDKETGSIVRVNSSEEIQELLLDGDDPGQDDTAAPDMVAERWAKLGEDDPPKKKTTSGGGSGAKKKTANKKNDGRLPAGAPDPRAPVGTTNGAKGGAALDSWEELGGTQEQDADGASGDKTQAGKKQKKKGGNQVLFKCG